MHWLIPLAAKSFLIAGGALLLLRLVRNRSAADRSWIAHLALAALLLLPLSLALPSIDVAGPAFLVGSADQPTPVTLPLASPAAAAAVPASAPPALAVPVTAQKPQPVDWSFWSYTAPAALLLLLTVMALGRLVLLKSRATVLVDAPWLTALARAQQRMGFKHGTALLTSNELPSPISWGVVRPVILLNREAAESHEEAEAIITHELAHVARLDWAKLLLARVAVALFWFNPFVWLLAREAHQLREEAADDAVLAADIDDTDYAKLLVGVARHECRGLLIGAHGVAPGRNSLSRRVKRVLDGAVKRAPGGWRWGSAAAFFAAGMAVPVAALNLVPATAATPPAFAHDGSLPQTSVAPAAAAAAISATDSNATSTTIASAATARAAAGVDAGDFQVAAPNGASVTSHNGLLVSRAPNGATVTVYPPDRNGRRKTVAVAPGGATAVSYMDEDQYRAEFGGRNRKPRSAIDDAIAMKAVGATPEYVAAIRSAAPQFRNLASEDIVELRGAGVTPGYVRALAAAGYANLTAEQMAGAFASGLSPEYIRGMAAAGYPGLSIHELTAMRAVGVMPDDVQRFRRAGLHPTAEQLVQIKALGLTPEEVRGAAASP